MPYSTFSIRTSNLRAQTRNSARVEAGILRAVSAFTFEENAEAAQLYGEIGLSSVQNRLSDRICVLAQGYFGASASLYWTGAIPMEPDFFIYGRIWPSAVTEVRIAFLTSLAT